MDDATRLAAGQLARMRGMTRMYHERFFSDVRFTTIAGLALLAAGWWGVPEAFLLVPVVALMGAVATAFDASYLLFARHYAAALEQHLNGSVGRQVLVASHLEDAYLFPLGRRKVVTVAWGGGFSWFGFVTVFLTFCGAALFGFGLALGWPVLTGHGRGWAVAYLGTLGAALLGALAAGVWWFPLGAGERRLRAVLEARFGEPSA
ncbi:MAG: hypothetical protein KQH83_05520 [Actinobacteria bacterium]|nr:hypothetical protein [Actinomycetota bacterium]